MRPAPPAHHDDGALGVRGHRHTHRPHQEPLDAVQSAVADDQQLCPARLLGQDPDRVADQQLGRDVELGLPFAGRGDRRGQCPAGLAEQDVAVPRAQAGLADDVVLGPAECGDQPQRRSASGGLVRSPPHRVQGTVRAVDTHDHAVTVRCVHGDPFSSSRSPPCALPVRSGQRHRTPRPGPFDSYRSGRSARRDGVVIASRSPRGLPPPPRAVRSDGSAPRHCSRAPGSDPAAGPGSRS